MLRKTDFTRFFGEKSGIKPENPDLPGFSVEKRVFVTENPFFRAPQKHGSHPYLGAWSFSPYLVHEIVKVHLNLHGRRRGSDPRVRQILGAQAEEVERLRVAAHLPLIPHGVHLQQDGNDGERARIGRGVGHGLVDAGVYRVPGGAGVTVVHQM